ncbi:hypothetical protein AY599_01260 [Leptolyngbya valderiana BDU 20041]|nr:hypothetical protein AY599_01260 [Leptolyngbya valderiana BDU 20041]
MKRYSARWITAAVLITLGGWAATPAQVTEPCEPQRLVSPPPISASSYGGDIATNGEYWFVSDRSAGTLCGGPPLECGTGAVFVYRELGGVLELVQTIVPSDVRLYDSFGASMDVDGDRLVVGGPAANWPGRALRQGVAYVYELQGEQWVETGRLEPPLEVTEWFGRNVYLSGDVVLVASNRPQGVYRYELVEGQWVQQETVQPPDAHARRECFGCTGMAFGEWFFIATFLDSTSSRDAGSVYAYRKRPDNTLEFIQKIESAGTGGFGHGIDFDGQTLAIGAMYTHRDVLYQGVVQTYLFDGTQWVLEQEMTHDDPIEPSLLGISVSIEGDTLLATENATRTGTVEGRVVRFERRPGVGWQEVGDLVAAPPVYARDFGEPVVMHDG